MIVEVLRKLSSFLPEVKAPTRPITLKEKIIWTVSALLIFFLMYNVTAFGVKISGSGGLDFLQVITASRLGSLLTVGIGPIVLASIFLQLFAGAGLISIDPHNPKDREKFVEAQKSLAIILAFVEAYIFVSTGRAPLVENTPLMAFIVTLQIALGSIILFYLDELISRYGIGSGISLFIAAGVSFSIIMQLMALITGSGGVIEILVSGGANAISNAILKLLPFFFTVLVFLVVAFSEGMKVEIPMSFGFARGAITKWPLRFFYVSNIPVIFASALLLNVQFFGAAIGSIKTGIKIGDYDLMQYIAYSTGQDNFIHDGLLYYITPIYMQRDTIEHWNYLNGVSPVFKIPEWFHALGYILFLSLSSIFFGKFWAETSGMDSESVVKQLSESGMQIPGFRRDPRLLKKVIGRYIDPLIVISSLAVGLLAGIADLTGALGTGTGILLSVGILYRLYEDLNRFNFFEIYPQIGSLLK